jgi:enoyl-CoA hydratase/carnithine racemase
MKSIDYCVKKSSALITLNRPSELNALTHDMLADFRAAVAAAERNAEVIGIIVTGAGRGFCAGMDISTLVSSSETDPTGPPPPSPDDKTIPGDTSMGNDFASGLAYLMTIRKPVIAAINGPCAGMGMSLALFCDLRFASLDAVFVTSFARRGLTVEHGQSWLLPRIVGPSRALDLLWSSRRVGAQEAQQIGLVDRTVAPDELLTHAQDYIETLRDYSAPHSLMMMKRQVYRHMNASLGQAMSESDALMRETLSRDDAKEGVTSYLEKRKPKFARLDI